MTSTSTHKVKRFAPLAGWLFAALVVAIVGNSADIGTLGFVNTWLIYSIGAIGLNLVTGVAGLASVGNGAFIGVGAYTAVLVPHAQTGLWEGLICAAIAGSIVAVFAGLPALRLSGIYLAVSTLALQFIVTAVAQVIETKQNKFGGFTLVDPVTVAPGVHVLTTNDWFWVLFFALVVAVHVGRSLIRSGYGRDLLAIREVGNVAEVFGVHAGWRKVSVFMGSSAMISCAGALLAYYTTSVFSENFTLDFAIQFVAMIIIGGLGSIGGSIVGAAVVVFIPYAFQEYVPRVLGSGGWVGDNRFYIQSAIYGLIIVVFLLFVPRGISGAAKSAWSFAARRLTPSPSTAGVAGTVAS